MINKLKKHIDFKLICILSAVYFVFVIIYSGKNAYLRMALDIKMDWGPFIFSNLFDWFLITLFMMLIALTTKYFIRKKTKLIYIISIHLFSSFFIGAFTIGISWIVENYDKPIYNLSKTLSNIFNAYIRLIDLHFLIYLSLATMIYIYYYFQQIQESKVQTIKLQEQLSKSHLKFLQSQMHPHFLFNTLNGIHSLIDINKETSKNMIVDLSDLLRNVLEKKDQNLIELQEELSILQKYIDIKKMRFSDQLKFHIDIENGLENILVPNMLIQPLIENATKHGFSEKHATLDIFMSIYKKDNMLIVKVENNGKQLIEDYATLLKKGTGLSNLKERLEELYKTNYKLKIYNNSNRVITKVNLPIELSISEITS
ncbi:MAG: histidine kinase [Algibacter sp.]